jgi:predicted nucleotidyltransferase
MNEPTAKQIEVLKIAAAWANKFPCVRTLYFFGSWARGAPAPSDIDIAIEYVDDVRKRLALRCYTDVNVSSAELELSLRTILPVRVGWTGLAVLSEGYDEKAWAAIRAGRLVHSCGKAQIIWTEPKAQN